MAVYQPESLNPAHITRQDTAELAMILFLPLVETDENGRFLDEGITKRLEIGEDGRSITLYLRENMKWHDGSEITAVDVLYSYYILGSYSEGNYWHTQLRTVRTMEQIDYFTVYMTLDAPVDEDHLSFLTFPVFPKDVYDSYGAPEFMAVGSGPFRVTDYRISRSITLQYFQQFFRGRPYISEIVVEFTRSEDAPQSAFLQGVTQILYEKTPNGLTTENLYGYSVYQAPAHKLALLYMNRREGTILSSLNMRQAIAYAIDAQGIIDQTQVRQGTATESILPPWIAESGLDVQYGYDEEMAYQLLGENRMAEITLVVSRENALSVAQAKVIYSMLSEIGLKVIIRQLDEAEYRQALTEGSFDLAVDTVRMQYEDDIVSILSSAGAGNFSGVVDETIDTLLANVRNSTDIQSRKLACRTLERTVFETLPVLPLYYSQQAVVVSRDLGGELSPTPFHVYRGIEKLYVRGQ